MEEELARKGIVFKIYSRGDTDESSVSGGEEGKENFV